MTTMTTTTMTTTPITMTAIMSTNIMTTTINKTICPYICLLINLSVCPHFHPFFFCLSVHLSLHLFLSSCDSGTSCACTISCDIWLSTIQIYMCVTDLAHRIYNIQLSITHLTIITTIMIMTITNTTTTTTTKTTNICPSPNLT